MAERSGSLSALGRLRNWHFRLEGTSGGRGEGVGEAEGQRATASLPPHALPLNVVPSLARADCTVSVAR